MNNPENKHNHVVLIDDERAMRESISQWLALANFEVSAFSNGVEAIDTLKNDFEGIVVTDLRMPDFDGMDVVRKTMEIDSDIPVILITGHGDVDSAVKAMQIGAYDFIEKPYEPDRLLTAISRAAEKRHLIVQNRLLQHKVNNAPDMNQRLLGQSAAMRQLRKEIAEFAHIDINILLCGETGSGKEVIARCLHDFGKRSEKTFHAIDCGALPSDGLEIDLFGTGGKNGQPGQLALANGGTLFLDDILNMPVDQQVKLLRVLQSREIRPVGETESSVIDIRVVSAANETLQKALKSEQFRGDLYFRLNTIELTVPPLRERDNDVIELFEHYTRKSAQVYERELPTTSNHDIAALKSYHWPGNVHELKNVAERFVLYRTQAVADILNIDADSPPIENLQKQMQAFERSMIEFALSQNNGNINDVCKQLGLPRRTSVGHVSNA